MIASVNWWSVASLVGIAAAQYFPPTPKDLKVVDSKHEEGVKISYKQVSAVLFQSPHIC